MSDIEQTMCTACHKRPAAPGHKRCQQCLDYFKAYSKGLRKKKKQEGMCWKCLSRPRVNDRFCEVCEKKHVQALPLDAKRAKYSRDRAKASGLCSYCRKRPAEDGYLECSECRKKATEKRAARVEAGLCACCGKKEPVPGMKHCIDCLEYYYNRGRTAPNEEQKKRRSEKAKERREAFRAAGLCTRCGKRKPIEGQTECIECRTARAKRWHELHDMKKREED